MLSGDLIGYQMHRFAISLLDCAVLLGLTIWATVSLIRTPNDDETEHQNQFMPIAIFNLALAYLRAVIQLGFLGYNLAAALLQQPPQLIEKANESVDCLSEKEEEDKSLLEDFWSDDHKMGWPTKFSETSTANGHKGDLG